MIKKIIAITIGSVLLFGCEESSSTMEKEFADGFGENSDLEATVENPTFSPEEAEMLLNSVPPPLELAMLVKNVGGEYSSEPLNPTTNVDKYNTNFTRALNLGVYGADLGYVNIYNETQDAFDYLGSVIELAEKLNVGQFFDFETIKELASNSDNLDTLLTLSTRNFAKMNSYLLEQKRLSQSVLMMTGGWIEGLNVACYVAQRHNSAALNERIGEQKVTLEQIVMLLEMFTNDKNVASLYEDMKGLQNSFNKVKINVTEGGTVTEMIDGIPIEVSQTVTEVIITPEVLKEIADRTKEIRAKFVD